MRSEVDVLIVGSGVAGLYCALNLDPEVNVMVLAKLDVDNNNTYLAQGGISTALNKEDVAPFVEDTLKAGKYKNRVEAVQVLAEESMENIDQIVEEYGMPLDKVDGKIDYTREGAHRVNRIVHCKDNTGEIVYKTLYKAAKERKNIEIVENACLLDIITKDGECIGARVYKDDKENHVFAKDVVLATGGVGGLFKNSTNQRQMTGDGLAIALRNGVEVENIEYIQIHPTAFYEEIGNKKRMLISESLRGEGAYLKNRKGERFIDELLPRDVVSHAIFEEMKKDGNSYVYLDARHLGEEYLKNRFTFIYNGCLERGTNIGKEMVKVAPAQHYFMGGIHVDLYSRTTMNHLYAVGETSCTGVHGANRLASNSLLEGLVFSKRAALDINSHVKETEIRTADVEDLNVNVEDLQRENRKMVIDEIIRNSEEFGNELFDYR